MKNQNLITAMLAAATVAAVPALAAADYRPTHGMTKLGEVGTHARDVEDFVPISPARRYDQIVVQARDGVVPLDGIKVQYADGRIDRPFAKGFLRPGERIVISVSDDQPIKMLVLDYNERLSSRYGDRATARVDVYGHSDRRRDDGRRADRPRYRQQRVDHRDRGEVTVQPRYEWRGGIYVRID